MWIYTQLFSNYEAAFILIIHTYCSDTIVLRIDLNIFDRHDDNNAKKPGNNDIDKKKNIDYMRIMIIIFIKSVIIKLKYMYDVIENNIDYV